MSSPTPLSAPAPGSDRVTDIGLLLLVLIWGANFTVSKWALDFMSPLAFNALRFPLAAAFLWAAMRQRPGSLLAIRGKDLLLVALLGVVGNGVYQTFFIFGLEATRAGNAGLILATTPAWTVLLSVLWREGTLDRWVILGVFSTLAGVTLVVMGGAEGGIGFGGETLRGDLLMVMAAVSWAFYTVASRGLILKYGALAVTAWTLWGGTALLVLVGLPDLARTELTSLPLGVWGAIAFAGVLSLGVSYLIWYRGIQRLGSARTAAYSNLVPLVALAVAWVGLGEVPTLFQLLGAAIILAGIFLSRIGLRPKPPSRLPPQVA